MATNTYSRYQNSIINGTQTTLPFIKLDSKPTDKQIVWKMGVDRTDKISDLYYSSPFYGFLIMLANPQFGPMEFDIPDNTIITIPFPLKDTLTEYNNKVKNIANTN